MAETNVFYKMDKAFPYSNRKFDHPVKTSSNQVLPNQDDIVSGIIPLPPDTLMIGMAKDGLPILFQLKDPSPCPVIIIGDQDSGKTNLLKTLAGSINMGKDPIDIQFGVVTNFLEEWQDLEVKPECLGIWPINHGSADQFIRRMVDWAKQPFHGRQVMVLFIDNLASLLNTDLEVRENLKWLLMNGATRQCWTIASLNIVHAIRMKPWLGLFNTRIFGYIQQPSMAKVIEVEYLPDFENKVPGLEFDLLQPGGWMRFWSPSLKPC